MAERARASAEGADLREVWVRWLVANPLTKVMSLLLALTAWFYVQGDEVHEELLSTQLDWELPSALVTTEPLPGVALLRVRGTRAATRNARDAVVRLHLDISGLDLGEHGLDLSAFEPVGLPQSVRVVGIEPSTLRFILDEESGRKVIVRPVVAGEPREGFEVLSTTLQPMVVDIRGPRSVIAELGEVLTEPIDVSGLDADSVIEVALALPPGLTFVGDVLPAASITVQHETEIRTVSDVPVYLWGQHRDYQASVSRVEVTLKGPPNQLRGVGPEEVVAIVHIPDPPQESSYQAKFGPTRGVRLRVVHPGPNVEVASVEPSTITVKRQ